MNKNNINTIVYFFINPIRASRRESFQLERLEKLGYNIYIIDAAKYYKKNMDMTSSVIHENTFECYSIEDFLNFRKLVASEKVLYITSDRYIEIASSIFHLIIKKKDKLLTFKTKSFSDKDFTTNKIRIGIDKMIKVLDNYLPLYFFKYYYKWRYGLFTPDYFLCSTSYLIPTKVYLTVKKTQRIIVHADDLNEIFINKSPIIDSNKKIGVFIDQVIPFASKTHPLVYPPGTLPENYLEKYYEEIARTLKQVKARLDLDEIVISMHPNSIHFKKELKDKLPGYTRFLWRTPELIKDCYVVLSHGSTALSYAVYYKKPIILLESKRLKKIEKIDQVFRFFKEKLNLNSIYIDQETIEFNDLKVDDKCYNEYLRKFLKDSEVEENAYYYASTKIINECNAEN